MAASPASALPLLTHWETYVAECAAQHHAPGLGPFAAWLASRVTAPAASPPPPSRARAAAAAAVHVWRYARLLRAGGRARGRSVDEFLLLYLSCQLPAPGPAKQALFRYAGLGAATGGQMLARLVGQGLLAEQADAADGRVRRVRATPAGQAAFEQASADVQAVSEAVVSHLPLAQLQALEALLLAVVVPKTRPPGT